MYFIQLIISLTFIEPGEPVKNKFLFTMTAWQIHTTEKTIVTNTESCCWQLIKNMIYHNSIIVNDNVYCPWTNHIDQSFSAFLIQQETDVLQPTITDQAQPQEIDLLFCISFLIRVVCREWTDDLKQLQSI